MNEIPKTRHPWYKPELKDLIWMAALFVIGFGSMSAVVWIFHFFSLQITRRQELFTLPAIATAQVISLGAAFGAPFKRKILGSTIAAFVMAWFWIVLYH